MKLHMPSKTTLPLDVKQTLKQAVQLLHQHKIPSAWLDAEVLLSYVLKKDRAYIVSHNEYKISPAQSNKFNHYISLRAKHFPLAYIIGYKEFYDLNFFVTPAVLVPRPESEQLVDLAIDYYNNNPDSMIIDVGTGSGCLIISVLTELSKKHRQVKGIGIDISSGALIIAKRNSKKYNLSNIQFIQSNLLGTFIKKPSAISQSRHILILANLPYVPLEILKTEPSISQEPRLALAGGHDGLDVYRRLAKQIYTLKKQVNVHMTILCEINPEQKKFFQTLWKERVIFKKDLAGKNRIGIIEIKKLAI